MANKDKVTEIIDLLLSVESLADAQAICQTIHQNPALYNLVMGGVPPVVPPPPPAPKTEAELKAEAEAELRAENAELMARIKELEEKAKLGDDKSTSKPK
jgi:type IV secretory pathway VirB10-like protein